MGHCKIPVVQSMWILVINVIDAVHHRNGFMMILFFNILVNVHSTFNSISTVWFKASAFIYELLVILTQYDCFDAFVYSL